MKEVEPSDYSADSEKGTGLLQASSSLLRKYNLAIGQNVVLSISNNNECALLVGAMACKSIDKILIDSNILDVLASLNRSNISLRINRKTPPSKKIVMLIYQQSDELSGKIKKWLEVRNKIANILWEYKLDKGAFAFVEEGNYNKVYPAAITIAKTFFLNDEKLIEKWKEHEIASQKLTNVKKRYEAKVKELGDKIDQVKHYHGRLPEKFKSLRHDLNMMQFCKVIIDEFKLEQWKELINKDLFKNYQQKCNCKDDCCTYTVTEIENKLKLLEINEKKFNDIQSGKDEYPHKPALDNTHSNQLDKEIDRMNSNASVYDEGIESLTKKVQDDFEEFVKLEKEMVKLCEGNSYVDDFETIINAVSCCAEVARELKELKDKKEFQENDYKSIKSLYLLFDGLKSDCKKIKLKQKRDSLDSRNEEI